MKHKHKTGIVLATALFLSSNPSEGALTAFVTFNLDAVLDGVTSTTLTQDGLTLTLDNPIGSVGNVIVASVDSGGIGIHPGLTFDFLDKDMTSLDVSFDQNVSILGYSVTQYSAGDFADGTETLTLGDRTGLDASIGNHVLLTPIEVIPEQRLTITESSGATPASQYFTLSSLTVQIVPEPSGSSLLALGALGLFLRRKR